MTQEANLAKKNANNSGQKLSSQSRLSEYSNANSQQNLHNNVRSTSVSKPIHSPLRPKPTLNYDDVEMTQEMDYNARGNFLQMDDLDDFNLAKEKSLEEVKQELYAYIDHKYNEMYTRANDMINTFHIDIIRQFEIQKHHIEGIVQEYMLEDAEEDDPDKIDPKFIVVQEEINNMDDDEFDS